MKLEAARAWLYSQSRCRHVHRVAALRATETVTVRARATEQKSGRAPTVSSLHSQLTRSRISCCSCRWDAAARFLLACAPASLIRRESGVLSRFLSTCPSVSGESCGGDCVWNKTHHVAARMSQHQTHQNWLDRRAGLGGEPGLSVIYTQQQRGETCVSLVCDTEQLELSKQMQEVGAQRGCLHAPVRTNGVLRPRPEKRSGVLVNY